MPPTPLHPSVVHFLMAFAVLLPLSARLAVQPRDVGEDEDEEC